MPRPGTLSAAHVRRAVLHAQGLSRPRPTGRVDRRHVRAVAHRFGAIQLDSVNVLARAHLMPFFSRLGPWDTAVLDRVAYQDNELFEYWGHAASLLPAELHPLLRWRMELPHQWRAFRDSRQGLVDAVEDAIGAHGPLTAAQVADLLGLEVRRSEAWWGWGETKRAVELLFHAGRAGALRVGNFERAYCRPDQAVPRHVLEQPTPDEATAKRALVDKAVRAHGVATAGDVAEYWRLKVREVERLLGELVADGSLEQVLVEGWADPAYVVPDLVIPRAVDVARLVSPFDPAMWHRPRIERIHRFDYKIEIYVPARQRVYGYYTLPFLLGDTFVGRVDLKADRRGSRLVVQSAHAEPDLAPRGTELGEVAERLAGELRLLADWLALEDVVVGDRGELAPTLASMVSPAGV